MYILREYSEQPIIKNVVATSGFKQVYRSEAFIANKNIIDIVLEAMGGTLESILNLTYLRVDAPEGTEMKVNGEMIKIGPTESLEYRDISITSAEFIYPTKASISVIYNGFKNA